MDGRNGDHPSVDDPARYRGLADWWLTLRAQRLLDEAKEELPAWRRTIWGILGAWAVLAVTFFGDLALEVFVGLRLPPYLRLPVQLAAIIVSVRLAVRGTRYKRRHRERSKELEAIMAVLRERGRIE